MQIKVTETQKLKESLHLLLVGVWGGGVREGLVIYCTYVMLHIRYKYFKSYCALTV